MTGWYYTVNKILLRPSVRTYIEWDNDQSPVHPMPNNFYIRLCDVGHLPHRQPPILRDPFTVVDHNGKVMFELQDKELIAKITANLLSQ